jgi:ABC-type multidrug transport system ATPase subunit
MAAKKNKSTETDTPQNAYFLSLELENVRCFGERQKIDFSDGNGKPKQWTILLGDNGTGKTTILQCLIASLPTSFSIEEEQTKPNALSPIFPIIDARYPSWFLKRSGAVDFIEVVANFSLLSDLKTRKLSNENVTTGFKLNRNGTNNLKMSKYVQVTGSSNCFAYGASRKTGNTSISEEKDDLNYETLFDETVLLVNPEEWLLRLHYSTLSYQSTDQSISAYLYASEQIKKKSNDLELVKETLKTILPDVGDIRFKEKFVLNPWRDNKPIVEFHTPYGWVGAKDLSLGYRTSMAWMVDFASRMFDLYPKSKSPLAEPAVVLIDEIDLHLHPKWQRDLLDWLSDLCPNTQFIVTTHSPLIVQSGLEHDANIFVCRRNEGKDFVEIEQINEQLKTLRVDQILSGDYFEVPPRGAKTEKLLDEKEAILSKPKLTKSDEKRLAELDEKIGFLPVSENQEDNEVMQILKEAADWVKAKAK